MADNVLGVNESLNIEDLDLELFEVDDSSMLEFMGASYGGSGCCSVVIMIC